VRNRHASTDGQVVPVDQPFNVGGQMMMFPGDTSGTATLDNVLNCRCFAAYYEVGDE